MALSWVGIAERKIISDDSAAHPWIFSCTVNHCFFTVAAYSKEDAMRKEKIHKESNCPWTGKVHLGGSVTLTLVEQMWDKMDTAYLMLRSSEKEFGVEDTHTLKLRSQLRGMAEMTAIFMTPHFHSADEIAREVFVRWQKKEAGETYETKGLASRRYELPRDTAYVGKRNRTVETTELPGPFTKLTPQENEAIKFAVESGMFTVEQLARTYGVTEATVRKIAKT